MWSLQARLPTIQHDMKYMLVFNAKTHRMQRRKSINTVSCQLCATFRAGTRLPKFIVGIVHGHGTSSDDDETRLVLRNVPGTDDDETRLVYLNPPCSRYGWHAAYACELGVVLERARGEHRRRERRWRPGRRPRCLSRCVADRRQGIRPTAPSLHESTRKPQSNNKAI